MGDRWSGGGLEKALRWLAWGLAGLFGLWIVLQILGLVGWLVGLILSLIGFLLKPTTLVGLAVGWLIYSLAKKRSRTQRRAGLASSIEEVERLQAEEELRRELEVPVRRK